MFEGTVARTFVGAWRTDTAVADELDERLGRERACVRDHDEPELRRVQAVIAADLTPTDVEGAEQLFRGAIACAQEFRNPVFERRCLVSFEQFLQSTGRRDAGVESRLCPLPSMNTTLWAFDGRAYSLRG